MHPASTRHVIVVYLKLASGCTEKNIVKMHTPMKIILKKGHRVELPEVQLDESGKCIENYRCVPKIGFRVH